MKSRTSSNRPRRSSAVDVSDPSRIQEREYEREPGWIAAPSRLMRM